MTTPYNPQQNKVPERNNKSIMEATKAISHDQDLLIYVWDEAVKTAVYVNNKLSHSALGNKNP